MSTPAFPNTSSNADLLGFLGVAYEVTKSPVNLTDIQTTKTGRRAAVINRARPLWKFRFVFEVLRDQQSLARNASRSAPFAEFQTLLSFVLGRYGQGLPFFITDPSDHKVTAQIIMASTLAGVTDFPMVRSMGNGGFVEPVGGVNIVDPIEVRIDGTPTTAYTANTPYDGWIRFDSAPGAGKVITADFSYYFKVAFEKDSLDFHTSLLDLWDARQVDLITVWP